MKKRNDVIGREGHRILERVRKDIRGAAKGDSDELFYLNRFVFSRLQLDERKIKEPIKEKLMKENVMCKHCGDAFWTIGTLMCIERIPANHTVTTTVC